MTARSVLLSAPADEKGSSEARPLGFSLAMRSTASLWSGSRLVFAHRREPLMSVAKVSQLSDISDRKALFASDDLRHRRVMHSGLFGDLTK